MNAQIQEAQSVTKRINFKIYLPVIKSKTPKKKKRSLKQPKRKKTDNLERSNETESRCFHSSTGS